VGLPQLDFRVPEATWFKSVLAGRFGTMPGLSATGTLAWPYKIAVVAVMAIVACGTLVTFGSAGAETPSSADVSALPGSDEASPRVEGQVVPPSTALLNSNDLMSSLNLMDYSPGDTTFSLTDDEDSEDDADEDSDDESNGAKKKSSKPTSTTKNPTTKPTTSTDDDEDSDGETEEPEPVEGPKHKQWEDQKEAYEDWEDQKESYEDCLNDESNPLHVDLGQCNDEKPGSEPPKPGSEPPFTS